MKNVAVDNFDVVILIMIRMSILSVLLCTLEAFILCYSVSHQSFLWCNVSLNMRLW